MSDVDYRMKQMVDPASIAALFQRKAEAEQQAKRQKEQDSMSSVQQTIAAASNLVSTSVAQSKERQKADFIKSLAEANAAKLAENQQEQSIQTFPNPISSMVPPTYTAATALQPTEEGNTLQGLAQAAPDKYLKQVSQTVLQTPQEKMANQVKGLQAAKDLNELQTNTGPVRESTKRMLSLAYKKLGQEVPDLTGITEQQARQDFLDVKSMTGTDNSNIGISEKQQQFDENKRIKFNDTTNYEKSARGATGQAATALRGVGQLKALFDGYKNDLTPQEWEEASIAWSRVLSSGGGTSSRSQIEALLPKTAVGNAKAAMQWFTNNPTGTNQQKFAERMKLGMQREEDYNTKYLNNKTLEQLGSYVPVYMRTDPEEAKNELEAKGLTEQDIRKKYPGLAKRVWGNKKSKGNPENEAAQFLGGLGL